MSQVIIAKESDAEWVHSSEGSSEDIHFPEAVCKKL